MSQIRRFNALMLLSACMLSGALTLSACSKSSQNTEMGVDPSPTAAAGDQTTGQYADQPAVVHKGEPNTQVDPYTGSTDKENYAGEHPIAPEQTVGERMRIAKENVKDAGRETGNGLKEAGQTAGEHMKNAANAAGESLREAGRNTKAAGQRMKSEVKEEFNNDGHH